MKQRNRSSEPAWQGLPRRLGGWIVLVATAVGLSACSEKPQVAGQQAHDTPAWDGAHNGFSATGWKAGSQQDWEAQLKKRSQGQNEYVRIGG